MNDYEVKIGKLSFKNPIFVASGTFGYGEEFKDFLDLDDVGAVITKTITLHEKKGNLPPRIVETASGMLNSIGLQNKGVRIFKEKQYPKLKKLNTNVIISIAGNNEEEFVECIKVLDDKNFPAFFELNLSCPNCPITGEAKYKLIAQDVETTEKIVSKVKSITQIPLIVKLTPNVTDIVSIAKAVECGGADAISLVNTYIGMAVDAETWKPLLGNVIGGLSGPAIKPLALKAVFEVYKNVSIPIIGLGGIMTGTDVVEFMLCGARAVQIGTANFVDPNSHARILKEFNDYLERKKISKLDNLVGKIII